MKKAARQRDSLLPSGHGPSQTAVCMAEPKPFQMRKAVHKGPFVCPRGNPRNASERSTRRVKPRQQDQYIKLMPCCQYFSEAHFNLFDVLAHTTAVIVPLNNASFSWKSGHAVEGFPATIQVAAPQGGISRRRDQAGGSAILRKPHRFWKAPG